MDWARIGFELARRETAWDPAPVLQTLSPDQVELLGTILEELGTVPRPALGGPEPGLSWAGRGWLFREATGWVPEDPAREANDLLARASAQVVLAGGDPGPLAALTAPLLAARRAEHEARLARVTAPLGVVAERWLGPEDEAPRSASGSEREGLLAARRGVVLIGDNARALRSLEAWSGRVQCAYLDPPYNTGSSQFAYRDRRPREVWLSFMDERLARIRPLLCPDGTLYAQIDQHEGARLRLLLERHLHFVSEIVWRIGWVSGFKTRAKRFIRNHDTILQFGRSPKPFFEKHYLPYPEGYRRRDGSLPKGKGIPLEDTWNCSPQDRLDSIQIVSFSREKVGRGDLTQKNEALLWRMVQASSRAGDWILDPFLGSGTSAAVALKTGRLFLGIERDPELVEEVILPRLSRVLRGADPYGITSEVGWSGGGAVQILELGEEGAPIV